MLPGANARTGGGVGLWSVFLPADATARESISTALWEAGTAGIIEEAGGLRAFFADENAALGIRDQFAAGSEVRIEDGSTEAVTFECDPILAGKRFYITSPGNNDPTPAGRMRLRIDAASAFGSGRHETTQLCIEALEAFLSPRDVVVDIGCGSGILSAAAQMLGAKQIFACDIHLDSLANASTHTTAPLFAGSADGIKNGIADVVLANISARVLDRIAADLQRVAKANGLTVISGFVYENPPKRFTPWRVFSKGEWLCWVCRREDINVSGVTSSGGEHVAQWWL